MRYGGAASRLSSEMKRSDRDVLQFVQDALKRQKRTVESFKDVSYIVEEVDSVSSVTNRTMPVTASSPQAVVMRIKSECIMYDASAPAV